MNRETRRPVPILSSSPILPKLREGKKPGKKRMPQSSAVVREGYCQPDQTESQTFLEIRKIETEGPAWGA